MVTSDIRKEKGEMGRRRRRLRKSFTRTVNAVWEDGMMYSFYNSHSGDICVL